MRTKNLQTNSLSAFYALIKIRENNSLNTKPPEEWLSMWFMLIKADTYLHIWKGAELAHRIFNRSYYTLKTCWEILIFNNDDADD